MAQADRDRQSGLQDRVKIESVPFRGGCITAVEPASLPFGTYSMVQNVRPKRPGFVKRPGQRALHTTPDSTNEVLSLYQFRKARVDEKHVFAQMGDGDVLDATAAPPELTTGVFGAEAYSGSAGQAPASWAALDDIMLHSNGVDQHKVYGGSSSYVSKFVVYKHTVAPPDVPDKGEDYSGEVSDGQASTVAVLDDLDYYTNNPNCFFIGVPVRAKSFTFTIPAPNGGSANTMAAYYKKSDNTWAAVSGGSDGTHDGTRCLATSGGTYSFTPPTDDIPSYMYGQCMFWYQFRIVTAVLDAEVEVSAVTFDSAWQSLENVWDGVPLDAVEAWVEGTTQYSVYSAIAVVLDGLVAGKKVYVFCTDPIEGIYWDVGATPNATGTSITSLKYWDGNSFETVGTTTDESAGLANSGWTTFPRQTSVQPLQFEGSRYYAYVYEVIWSADLAADTQVGIQVRPYFDIEDMGKGQSCCAWKNRMAYSFTRWGEYVYISGEGAPLVLNGEGYGILEAGDGRPNKVLAMRPFYNEMLVWQEEKGVEGGCTTLFEGYSPTTYGKLVLSTRVGIMNSKCAVVVDGVLTSTATDEQLRTLAFWISRYGVCVSDGRTIYVISDDIGDRFDPTDAKCITRGCEGKHWLKYDSTYNCLRLGLVCGEGGTVPNIFPVFDLVDKCWYYDVLGQELSTMEEVEAGSENVPVVQIGGGTADGTIYQLNYGQNDVTTAVSTYVDMEFSARGMYFLLSWLMFRCKAQSAGNITITVSANGIAQVSGLSRSMVAEITNQTIRRHLDSMNVVDQHVTVRFAHATATQDVCLLDVGVDIKEWERR